MNDRQREVYILLLRLYPDSPAVSVATACALEVLIADRLRRAARTHAADERGASFAPLRHAVGRRVAVYRRGDHAAMRGILTRVQQDADGGTWAIFDGGRGIRLQEDLRWEEVGREGAQA